MAWLLRARESYTGADDSTERCQGTENLPMIFPDGLLGRRRWVKYLIILERVKGIEPSSSAWKAVALPLSYTRAGGQSSEVSNQKVPPVAAPTPITDDDRHLTPDWWGREDSNLRRLSQRIYSPISPVDIATQFPLMWHLRRVHAQSAASAAARSLRSFRLGWI